MNIGSKTKAILEFLKSKKVGVFCDNENPQVLPWGSVTTISIANQETLSRVLDKNQYKSA
jgi:hypothetical protein